MYIYYIDLISSVNLVIFQVIICLRPISIHYMLEYKNAFICIWYLVFIQGLNDICW